MKHQKNNDDLFQQKILSSPYGLAATSVFNPLPPQRLKIFAD